MSISRRDFIGTSTTAVAGFAMGSPLPELPPVAASRPIVIASSNGIRGVKVAYDMIVRGADPLDAAVEGVKIQELDPEDQSVGLGGLPNADGVVQLDASCMHGPTRRAGAVACLEGIATASMVAKAVMDHTDHILLVGEGARQFALQMGFKEQNLLTEESRLDWLRWKSTLNSSDNWLDLPPKPLRTSLRKSGRELTYDAHGVPHTYGTINMNAVTATGDIASVTTTSGRSWKVPGRVGDSPIIGAGQYCDNNVGAAGSTGRGEANIKVCGAFLVVEFMRQGMSPEQALLKVMERVIAMTERRLLDERGRPHFDLSFYAVTKDGRYAGGNAYEGGDFAVCDAAGARIEKGVYLFKESERPKGLPTNSMLPSR